MSLVRLCSRREIWNQYGGNSEAILLVCAPLQPLEPGEWITEHEFTHAFYAVEGESLKAMWEKEGQGTEMYSRR